MAVHEKIQNPEARESRDFPKARCLRTCASPPTLVLSGGTTVRWGRSHSSVIGGSLLSAKGATSPLAD